MGSKESGYFVGSEAFPEGAFDKKHTSKDGVEDPRPETVAAVAAALLVDAEQTARDEEETQETDAVQMPQYLVKDGRPVISGRVLEPEVEEKNGSKPLDGIKAY